MGDVLKKLRESLGGAVYTEIFGREELTLTGCTALLDFDSGCVYADTVEGRIEIRGGALCVEAFSGDVLVVSGRISSVGFLEDICS
ncbi:MAG: YabP/YqfC family sporulation protein [Clostridia bacterium]|nr:YabP/YqfC family sporulation protein [Clostridia bacterium]